MTEGEKVNHGDRRSRRLAVVVAVQNVLVAACLVVTLYVYWTVQERVSSTAAGGDIHIQVEAVPDITRNSTLQLAHIYSNFKMDLLDGRRIYTSCTGSYLLHLHTCYTSLKLGESRVAELQLQARKDEEPLSSFFLNTTHEVCRGLHRITYLRAKQNVSLHLFLSDGFKLKNMTVDLSFLQGGRCEP
ncbi:hypothetical protein L3Q82_008031 [Xyrichtys novacula]|uniref:TNF family profile domain-containing protein n=1 Tax=Xyrichtys novacula TaxID=13765 RepID=A0AAV1FGI7_XYRNO|nr:hypothetical protein L3Q82_008031 [Xyrichtys novacula]